MTRASTPLTTRGHAAAAALAVLSLAVAPTASGQAQPLISFDPGETLEVTWADLEEGATVEIFNETTGRLDLMVLVTAFRGPKRVPAANLIAIEQLAPPSGAERQPVQIPVGILAGESKAVELRRADDADPEAGVYDSSIVAFAPGGRALARLPIELTVAPVPQAEPVVEKMTYKSFRWRLIGWDRYPRATDLTLPLKPSDTKLSEPKEKRLGTITKGSTVVTVTYDTTDFDDSKNLVALGLKFDGLSGAGEYEGTLDLQPASDEGEITFKLIHSDAIWVPLVVLALGLLLGNWISKQVGVVLRHLDLRARVVRLSSALETAQSAFDAKAQGKDWARYELAEAVAAEQAELNERVDELRAAYTLQIPDKKAEEVIEAIGRVRARIRPFGSLFALNLAGLEAVRNKIAGPPTEPLQSSGDWNDEAKILEELDEVLDPKAADAKLASLDDFENLSATVERLNVAARTWRNLEWRLAEAQRRLNVKYPPTGNPCTSPQGEPTDPAYQAQDGLCDAYRQLWELATAGDVAAARFENRVSEVENAVDQLAPPSREPGAEVAVNGRPGTLGKGAEGEEERRQRDWTRKWQALVDEGRRRSAALWILATVLALATGLHALYVGKAFGGLWDYIALFLWGVSSKFIVDLVAKGLDSIGLGGLRSA